MLSRENLMAPFFEGETAPDDRVIGTEYECLVQNTDTGRAARYDGRGGIGWLLEDMAEAFNWTRVSEQGRVIALIRDGKSITLEPGGQFEMSGAALKTLSETELELREHVAELAALEARYPVRFIWRGMNPWQVPDSITWMPKGRYRIMRRYMPTRGDRGVYMMGLTCTVQANLDYTSQGDFAKKMKVSTGVGALVTALFANSPILAGKPSGYQSYRAHIWTRTDPDRAGLHRFVFDTDCGYGDYVDWAVDVPMYFVQREGGYIDLTGRARFSCLMKGKIEGVVPRPSDWTMHMSTLFPETRARPHLEVRTSDCVPPEMITSCPALWKGLLYDEGAAENAWDLVKRFSFEERQTLLLEAAKNAIHGDIPGRKGKIGDLCRDLVAIAKLGLLAEAEAGRGDADDVSFLRPLEGILESNQTLADRTLAGTTAAVPPTEPV